MNMEARVGVVVEGGQRALNTAHGSVVETGTRKFLRQQQQQQQQQQHQSINAAKRSLNQQSQIGTVQQLLAGGIAGAFSKTCTAPLARLTILFQVNFLGLVGIFFTLILLVDCIFSLFCCQGLIFLVEFKHSTMILFD